MPVSRSALIKGVQAAGYAGATDTPEPIKAWASANLIEIPDFEASWNTAKTISFDDDAPAPEKKDRTPGELGKSVAAVNKGTVLTPMNHRHMAERRVYQKKITEGKSAFLDVDIAEGFGAWMRLVGAGKGIYSQRAYDEQIAKNYLTTNPISGSDFVPPEFEPEVIRLVEQYGAYMKAHGPRAMSSTQLEQPKRTTGPTVVYPGEGQTVTESSSTTQLVKAQTKDGLILTTASLTELEASAVNVADFIAQEFATALSQDQDQKTILGAGGSADANYTGWIPAMASVTTNGMAVSASGNTWGAVTSGDFANTLAACPQYVLSSPTACWLMNSAAFYSPELRVALGLGGVSFESLYNGPTQPKLLGYPVYFAQVMPAQTAVSTVFALFGDYKRGALFGIRQGGIQIATSDQAYFAQALFAWRAKVSWAFTVHAPGVTSTAQSGPVASLATTS